MDEDEDDIGIPANSDEITLTPGPRLDMVTAKLAQEFAAGLLDAKQIVENFNITSDQMRVIAESPAFRELYAEAKMLTGGGMETGPRGRMKADMVIEDGLIRMHTIIQDLGASPSNVTDAFKAVAAISSHSVRNKAADAPAELGRGFTLNITLAGDKQPTTIEGKILPPDDAED